MTTTPPRTEMISDDDAQAALEAARSMQLQATEAFPAGAMREYARNYELAGGSTITSITAYRTSKQAIQADNDYGAMVKSKQGEFLTAIITCAPEEVDKVYDEYMKTILETGAAQMIEEFRAAYQSGNYRGTFPGGE